MCGKCCSYEIPVTLLDINRIAQHFHVNDRDVFERYVQMKPSMTSTLFMIAKKENRECVFLDDKKRCSIHEAKPGACLFFVCVPEETADEGRRTMSIAHGSCNEQLPLMWEHKVSAQITKRYIELHNVDWDQTDYFRALANINDNIVTRDTQKFKIGRMSDGNVRSLIYDCSKCKEKGECSPETPVTLDDITRIAQHLNLDKARFFKAYLDEEPSRMTGGLKMKREAHCVFFQADSECPLKDGRPMHCQFTICPKHMDSAEITDVLFLGSGTIEQQFRHQVALAYTREYVQEQGTGYNKARFKRYLAMMDNAVMDKDARDKFAIDVSPYRYIDDTLFLKETE